MPNNSSPLPTNQSESKQMVLINTIEISPPLLNSSCAWSSDLEQLTELYKSPYTGAVTTRSATDRGFQEDDTHTVAFSNDSLTTINSFGYSPHPLSQYLEWIENIFTSHPSGKPVIISIAASDPTNLHELLQDIQALREKLHDHQTPPRKCKIAVEFNVSCPNIANSAPLGYIHENIVPFVVVMRDAIRDDPTLTIGCKIPPYVYQAQFTDFLQMVSSVVNGEKRCPISFLTSTNTLGNALLFSSQATSTTGHPDAHSSSDDVQFALPTPLGGLAGESIHALSVGNVFTFKRLIASGIYKGLGDLKIIGVGGVNSKAAVERMRKAGADAVACATLFGKEGVRAFEILST